MAVANYRGFHLTSVNKAATVWQTQIKKHVLSGQLAALKKSIDWFYETASLIDPRVFESKGQKQASPEAPQQETFHGQTLKNDTGNANEWYCLFHGRLIKGGKAALQQYILANPKTGQSPTR